MDHVYMYDVSMYVKRRLNGLPGRKHVEGPYQSEGRKGN
jgi:hypothetical protein